MDDWTEEEGEGRVDLWETLDLTRCCSTYIWIGTVLSTPHARIFVQYDPATHCTSLRPRLVPLSQNQRALPSDDDVILLTTRNNDVLHPFPLFSIAAIHRNACLPQLRLCKEQQTISTLRAIRIFHRSRPAEIGDTARGRRELNLAEQRTDLVIFAGDKRFSGAS